MTTSVSLFTYATEGNFCKKFPVVPPPHFRAASQERISREYGSIAVS
jgi:hypothetical protein